MLYSIYFFLKDKALYFIAQDKVCLNDTLALQSRICYKDNDLNGVEMHQRAIILE